MDKEPSEHQNSAGAYVLRTILPLILGSLLTLSGAIFAERVSQQDKLLAELRTEYATFFTETDSIGEDTNRYFNELMRIFARYYDHGNFSGMRLTSEDLRSLEELRNKNGELLQRTRKAAYSLLLLEPTERAQKEVRFYLDSTTEYLNKCDKLAASLPRRFEYDSPLARELEANGTLIQELGRLDGEHENKVDAFHDFVDLMLQDSRWRK